MLLVLVNISNPHNHLTFIDIKVLAFFAPAGTVINLIFMWTYIFLNFTIMMVSPMLHFLSKHAYA